MDAKRKAAARQRRHARVRRQVQGTPERPRLAVYRSNRSIYAQVIDDAAGRTLAAASSRDQGLELEGDGKIGVSKAVGKLVAHRARQAGVERVVFDRGGWRFQGRVAALAEGVREGGIEL
jgi:large subunit ribosomal protein L18